MIRLGSFKKNSSYCYTGKSKHYNWGEFVLWTYCPRARKCRKLNPTFVYKLGVLVTSLSYDKIPNPPPQKKNWRRKGLLQFLIWSHLGGKVTEAGLWDSWLHIYSQGAKKRWMQALSLLTYCSVQDSSPWIDAVHNLCGSSHLSLLDPVWLTGLPIPSHGIMFTESKET